MAGNQSVKSTKPKARHRRGASYVGTALVVSVAAGVGALAIGAAGHASSDTAQREATCIQAGFEGCTAGTAEAAGVAPSDMARTAEPTPHERSHWDNAGAFAKGFVVDAGWGTVTGTWDAITHPVETAEGVAYAATHPVEAWQAISSDVGQSWENDPWATAGAGAFQIATLPIGVSKAGSAAKLAAQLGTKGKVIAATAKAADKVGDTANLGDEAAKIAAAGDKVGDTANLGDEAAKVAGAAEQCVGGHCSCFVAGTPVVTRDGARPIEAIKAGDFVLARDPETGATELRRVVRTFVTPDRDVLDVRVASASGATDHFVTTPNHPFFVAGRGFVPAGELDLGDPLVSALGEEEHIVGLTSLPDHETVFNLEVEGAHTYFVGKTATWVHNQCGYMGGMNPQAGRSAADDYWVRIQNEYRAKNPPTHKLGDDPPPSQKPPPPPPKDPPPSSSVPNKPPNNSFADDYANAKTPEELKSKYRKDAMQHHPDHGGDPEKFMQANTAYEWWKTANGWK